jgi:protein-S-isoprenylcysteine O-methyltransferase Ste14
MVVASRTNARAWAGLAFLALVLAVLLFGLAGTLRYAQAWVFLAAFLGPCALITLDLMRRDPALLERRISGGPLAERRASQRLISALASVAFLALIAIPALDHRFGWSRVALPLIVLGDLFVVLGLFIVFLVYRENTFTSATIEVVKDQKVVSSGPYGIVRHPMYAGATLFLFGTPLALGSYAGLLALLVMIPALVWRVRYRLIPGMF